MGVHPIPRGQRWVLMVFIQQPQYIKKIRGWQVPKKIRPFDTPGTYFHNYTLDVIMPSSPPNAWKVLCVAIRQTWGWVDKDSPTGRKQEDQLSHSQFMEKTGIGSKATVHKAIHYCLDKGYLGRRKVGEDKRSGLPLYAYYLNTDYEVEGEDEEAEPAPSSGTETVPHSGTETVPQVTSGTETVPLCGTETVPHSGTETVPTKEKQTKTNKEDGGGDEPGQDERVVYLLELAQATQQVLNLTLARKLVAPYTAEQVLGLVTYAGQTQGLREPLAFVISRLRSGELPEIVLPDPSPRQEAPQVTCPGCGQTFDSWQLCPDCGRCEDCCQGGCREPADPVLAEAERIWQATLGELQLQMTRGTFNQWLKPTRVLERRDGVFVIGVDSDYMQDWLDSRLRAKVERTLAGVVGGEVEVEFVVSTRGRQVNE